MIQTRTTRIASANHLVVQETTESGWYKGKVRELNNEERSSYIIFCFCHEGNMKLYGGIETGGTKCICIVAGEAGRVVAETAFPTTMPDETITRASSFFLGHMKDHKLSALGIGTFGPVDLDPRSRTFGFITTTPKPGWSDVDLLGKFQRALQLPAVIDTDVNAAAQGEYTWGNGAGMDPLIYYTIGTGIGMGGRINGSLMHGLAHPEAGHMVVRHDRQEDPFEGSCIFHGDCFEGLASGLAIERRWQLKGETLPDNHPAWKIEANYIAQALVNTILIMSPRRIVLGGGVMQRSQLFPMIRNEVKGLLKGYVKSNEIMNRMDDFVVPAKLGNKAGALGAIDLASRASM